MKIHLKIIILTLNILSTIVVFANTTTTFIKANEAYVKKNYAVAIQLYNDLLANGYQNSDIYYNLGNAYLRNEELAKAILNYERALRLNPSNEDIKHNIAFANQKIVDEIDILPEFFVKKWLQNTIKLLSSNGWAILSLGLLITMLVIIALLFLSSIYKRRIFLFFLSSLIFLFFALSISFAFLQYKQLTKTDEAIITQSSVTVKSMPDLSGTELFTIHEGLKVTVTDSVGKWIEIILPNGNKGWVPSNSIEII